MVMISIANNSVVFALSGFINIFVHTCTCTICMYCIHRHVTVLFTCIIYFYSDTWKEKCKCNDFIMCCLFCSF